jgi:hypothetical protein
MPLMWPKHHISTFQAFVGVYLGSWRWLRWNFQNKTTFWHQNESWLCTPIGERDYEWSHNPTSQKRCWTTKKYNQNQINIYVLPFKAMPIMLSYCFFIHINVKEFKPKNPFDEILSFKFWFRRSKSEQERVKHESVLQRTIKRIHIINHIWWGKN